MRQPLLLVLLLLFQFTTKITAQERLTQSLSFSMGHLLTKGFHITGHYHLDNYNELRVGYASNNRTYQLDSLEATTLLQLQRISLNYVKGLRSSYNSLHTIGIYLGSGLVGSTATLKDSYRKPIQSIGIRFFAEVDIALGKKLSLYLRTGSSWMLTQHLGKNGEIVVGFRGYF